MGTIVTIATVGEADDAVRRAFEWFRDVEARCSRFDGSSELSRLSANAGAAVPVSALVFEALCFALHVADISAGAFDPVVGGAMAACGFNRHYVTGAAAPVPANLDGAATFRDVILDPVAQTVTLVRPLALDLGGVAKGLPSTSRRRNWRAFGISRSTPVAICTSAARTTKAQTGPWGYVTRARTARSLKSSASRIEPCVLQVTTNAAIIY